MNKKAYKKIIGILLLVSLMLTSGIFTFHRVMAAQEMNDIKSALKKAGETKDGLIITSDMKPISTLARSSSGVATGPHTWVDPGGISHRAAYIEIDGKVAFCIDPDRNAPYGGQGYQEGTAYNNGIKAILYYGYGGDGNEIGNTIEDYLKTHVALSNWEHGKRERNTYSNQDSEVWSLIQHAKNEDAPNYDIKFSKSKVTSSVSGDVQKSETIKLNGTGDATLKIPSEVTIYVNGKKKQTGGNIKINGGQSFYFTAPMNYDKDFVTGNVNANFTELAALLYLPNNSNYQRLVTGQLVTDPIKIAGFSVDFENRQRKITVNYIDEYTGEKLKTFTETKDIGTKYSYSPPAKIKNTKGDGEFIPKSTKAQNGTLGNKDLTINFYFNLQLTITIEHKDNYTGEKIAPDEKIKVLRGDKFEVGPSNSIKFGQPTDPANSPIYINGEPYFIPNGSSF